VTAGDSTGLDRAASRLRVTFSALDGAARARVLSNLDACASDAIGEAVRGLTVAALAGAPALTSDARERRARAIASAFDNMVSAGAAVLDARAAGEAHAIARAEINLRVASTAYQVAIEMTGGAGRRGGRR
jgi:hypothetical protein